MTGFLCPCLLWNFYLKPGFGSGTSHRMFLFTGLGGVGWHPPVLVLPPRHHLMLELSKQKGVVYRKHPNHKWFATWVDPVNQGIIEISKETPLKKRTWIPKMAIFKAGTTIFQTIFLGSMLVFGGVHKTNSEFTWKMKGWKIIIPFRMLPFHKESMPIRNSNILSSSQNLHSWNLKQTASLRLKMEGWKTTSFLAMFASGSECVTLLMPFV